MNTEIGKLEGIGVWELVELMAGGIAIGCQWVYTVKTKPDGKFDIARAQVITQGFTQRPGMDYFDIMAPVIKFYSPQTLLAIGNALNWEIEMVDIKSAFVNSDLNEKNLYAIAGWIQ